MLDLVGNTPLVRLHQVLDGGADDGPLVLVETKKDLSQIKLPFDRA